MHTKILIVDDDTIVLDLLEYCFCGYNCTVTRAVGGRRALLELQKNEFDLVITDLQMGRISGLDVVKEAKRISPATTVFILTGFDDGASARAAFRLGVDAYLLKPISFGNLIDRLAKEGFSFEKRSPTGRTGARSNCFTTC